MHLFMAVHRAGVGGGHTQCSGGEGAQVDTHCGGRGLCSCDAMVGEVDSCSSGGLTAQTHGHAVWRWVGTSA